MDWGWTFWLPLLLLFGTAIFGAFMRRRATDLCLLFFNQKRVVVCVNRLAPIVGIFHAEGPSAEIIAGEPSRSPQGYGIVSTFLFEADLDQVEFIFLAAPLPGSEAFREWQASVTAIRHPSLSRKMWRWLRNGINTLRDALSQAVSMLLGAAKKTTPVGKIAAADQRTSEMSEVLLSAVPHSFEALLERYLGSPMIAETTVQFSEGSEKVPIQGTLQEYSEKFILLRDVLIIHPKLQDFIPESYSKEARFDLLVARKMATLRYRATPRQSSSKIEGEVL